MKGMLRAAAWLSCVLAGSAVAQGGSLPPEELFERLLPSVWTVHAFDASGKPIAGGSGVVVGPGSVVTNCHVLAKASRVTVGRENVSYGASLEHPDAERDLCLLKVANFTAPAVTVAAADGMKIGSRVYAIGSPRGLEQTISDGLLSGLRKMPDGSVHLQVTVPISPGSSGGGLFDAQGRLIGITSFVLRDSQNLNFAVPATWIAEVPQRAAAAIASLGRTGADAPAAGGATGSPVAGRVYEYRLTDRLTGKVSTVQYRVDRLDGERVVFNGGSRVESRKGEVLVMNSPLGGDADAAMPPGGWVKPGLAVGATWKVDYITPAMPRPMRLQLDARVTGEHPVRVGDATMRALQIEFTGYADRNVVLPGTASGRYRAIAWYAPSLGRMVRFEVNSRGGVTGGQYVIEELLELVAIH